MDESVMVKPSEPELQGSVGDDVERKIKNAWIAGVVSGLVTLAVTLLAISGTSILGFSAWELIDVAFVFGLSFGIYKKSRTCAVLMLVYFTSAKILIMFETGKPTGLVLGLIFIYFFYQGVVGTFRYHKQKRLAAESRVAGA